MTPEIKQRIQQIRQGKVPKGYKKTKDGIIPNEWNRLQLGECVQFLDEKRIPIKENERKSGPFPYYGASGIIDYVDDYIFDGDYILLGEDGANIIDRSSPLAFRVSGKCWINNHAHVLSPYQSVNINYLTNYLESLSYVRYNTGSAQPKLNQDICRKIEIALPPLSEQTAIAEILTTQDRIIELKEQLLAEKKRQKKYLMQQLLTGKKRLKGFKGEWRKCKLGEIGDVLMCKRVMKDETSSNGDIPFYKIGTFGGAPDAYISKSLFDKYKDKYPYPKEGEILLSAAGTVGRRVIFDGKPSYYQDSNIVWIENDEQMVKNSFLYYMYDVIKWNTDNGGVVSRLYNNSIKTTEIPIPPLPEQTAIAEILSTADQEIELLQQSIEAEKLKKKSLMQLLLTGIVRVTV